MEASFTVLTIRMAVQQNVLQKEFQKENGLPITGVVDSVTAFEMMDVLSSDLVVAEESASEYQNLFGYGLSLKLAECNGKIERIKATKFKGKITSSFSLCDLKILADSFRT